MTSERPATGVGSASADAGVAALVQKVLSAIPAGCTWIVPVRDEDGVVVDFRIAATGEEMRDLHGRGIDRVEARLSELYPSLADGSLWRLYLDVLDSGLPARLSDFRYDEKLAGVVADAHFEVSVHPLLDGLLVWWQRVDEVQRRLERTELLGRLGWAEYDLATGLSDWSPGMYRIFERDPELGPMSRAEQAAALLPDDRGISETAWQTLDSGAVSDVTVRFRPADSVKYLRVLSDIAQDADGNPLKIYAVVQDVTAREDSRSEIERLTDELRNREMTAIAEHRLAAQLQNMIQPVPVEPYPLAGLHAGVNYLPAESAAQVGGDWYHAADLPNGQVALAIGDVAGHGLEAASAMAHLRYALVAWLSIGIADPGALVGHLNRLCTQLRVTSTAVVAVYDARSRTLRWARGGHPAPLLARAGTAESLQPPSGMLLGADHMAEYDVASVHLRPDDLLLFYTDGLVERRTRTEDMLAKVKRILAEVSQGPVDVALSGLQGLLRFPNLDDDTCTLAVRILP